MSLLKDNTSSKSAILQYWKAIELFSPPTLPKIAPDLADYPVFLVRDGDLLPWDNKHSLQQRPTRSVWKYLAYCGIYSLDKMRDLMEKTFGKDKESFDEKVDQKTALFSISLTPDGRPLFDSFVLSTCAWGCGRLVKPSPKNSRWMEGFDSTSQELSYHLKENFKIQQNDPIGEPIANKGYSVGNTLSLSDLFTEIKYFIGKLNINTLEVDNTIIIQAMKTSVDNIYLPSDDGILNSFYLADLEKISKAIELNDLGVALSTYLSEDKDLNSSKRVDLRKPESTDVTLSRLAPSNMPIGRWPSKDHHPLVYAQQLAINSIFLELSDKAGIFAINGPPGTGKTTLLRDLIASVVVDRAIKVSELTLPSGAFLGEKNKIQWKSNNFPRTISLWKEDFKGYEIVVASSNNGAVENVTLEIPSLTSIDLSWQNQVDYFSNISTLLINQPAWALLAGQLGSRKNCNNFATNFWAKKKQDNEVKTNKNHNGSILTEQQNITKFVDYLKNIEATKKQVDWVKAVSNFNSVLREEQNIRKLHIEIYNLILKKQKIINHINKLENTLSINRIKENQIQQILIDLQEKENVANSFLQQAIHNYKKHTQNRPSLLQILFSFAMAYFRWRTAKSKYQMEIIEAQNVLNSYKDQILKQKELYTNTNAITTKLLLEIKKAKKDLLEIKSTITKKADSLGTYLPDVKLWQNDETRELSSPWLQEAWNKVRAKVFIEALNLHKTFIEANATIFRQNLQAAMDILYGSIPTTVPINGVLSAWTTLFFVVPVVSTTFASFDRLFSHLGKENIGWLLIDEAGQASAQASVGALWRTKRAVVVGDPLQLEPISNIPFTTQQALRTHFGVSEKWLPSRISTQALADSISSLGTYLPRDNKPIWVGCPLRVHRRCDKPMFSISNLIAYDNMMVFGTPKRSKLSLTDSCWIDVKGLTANDHWIEEEGKMTVELITQLITNGTNPNDIFLISPFRSVVYELNSLAKNFKGVQSGTIHTVQGKEADIVILVLGGNPSKPGVKNWASQKPNLLNVAASRAKRRLYVVGNKNSWQEYTYFSDLAELLPTYQKT